MHLNVDSNNTKIWPQNVLQITGKEYRKIDIGHNILYFPEENLRHITPNKIVINT